VPRKPLRRRNRKPAVQSAEILPTCGSQLPQTPTNPPAAAIEPPEQVAAFHNFYFATSKFTAARETLAARAATAADWEELSESPEMAAYRAAIAEDKQACTDFEAEMDATAERGVFADVPWFPSELSEVVEGVLGCEGYPERPEDVYRPPPTSTP
jgi:hypothetical protein